MTGRRRAEPLRLALATLGLALVGAAQGPTLEFTAPDGSRFLLVRDAATPQVHWAIASPLDPSHDPAGFEGLAWATLQASLGGTWRTGSRDAARERETMARLDEAWQRMLADPRDTTVAATIRQLDERARELADPDAFGRVLAAAPSFRPELRADGDVGVLVLTTLPEAIATVGRLLLERREDQALRDLPRSWLRTFGERLQRHQQATNQPLHAELLALSLPDHPAARLAAPPAAGAPTHGQALAVWAATQRPERTVHVLLGNFDVAAARQVLESIFTRSALPPAGTTPPGVARPLAGLRRSIVPGVPPTAAVAWVLPADVDRFVLATAVQWLAGGPNSQLARELQRQGRTATLRAQAPWPGPGPGGSLLLLEAVATDVSGLADLVLAACRDAAARPPEDTTLQQANAALQGAFAAATTDARGLTVATAVAALRWPRQAPTLQWPDAVDGKAVQQLLARIVATPPVLVEGRP